jgi:hypothetical protein
MTTAMNLTEFLDARITEDEVGWKAVRAREDDAGLSVTLFHHGKPLADRMLTECAAKRRILDLADEHTDSADPIGHLGTMYYTDDYESVLRALALPYADHPDYCKAGTL